MGAGREGGEDGGERRVKLAETEREDALGDRRGGGGVSERGKREPRKHAAAEKQENRNGTQKHSSLPCSSTLPLTPATSSSSHHAAAAPGSAASS